MAYREKDYIKRQIEMFARLFARVLGLREAGRSDEALAEAKRGAGEVFGLEYDTLARLDVPSARALLRDPELIDAYAQLLGVEADMCAERGDTARADALRARAAAMRDS
jgi:hypothetical protein